MESRVIVPLYNWAGGTNLNGFVVKEVSIQAKKSCTHAAEEVLG